MPQQTSCGERHHPPPSPSLPPVTDEPQPSHRSRYEAYTQRILQTSKHLQHLQGTQPMPPCSSQHQSHTLVTSLFAIISYSCRLQRLKTTFKRVISLLAKPSSLFSTQGFSHNADRSVSTLPVCLWKAMINSPKSQAAPEATGCTVSWLIRSCLF